MKAAIQSGTDTLRLPLYIAEDALSDEDRKKLLGVSEQLGAGYFLCDKNLFLESLAEKRALIGQYGQYIHHSYIKLDMKDNGALRICSTTKVNINEGGTVCGLDTFMAIEAGNANIIIC